MSVSLNYEVMDRLWSHADHSLIDGMVRTSEEVFAKYDITTAQELADFMAQGSEEVGAGWEIEEDLNYSASRLIQVWPSKFPNHRAAMPFAHNPRELAEHVYGGRGGNRPGASDGWVYRGRGFIQVTFRGWYQKLSEVTGLDLVGNPDLVNSPEHFLEVGAAFWKIDGVNAFADKGDFRGETLRINGGYTNLAQRMQWRSIWRKAFHVV